MDDFFYWIATSPWGWIVSIILAFAAFGVIGWFVKLGGVGLRMKFQKLGELRGLTYSQIAAAVGPANSISGTDDGGSVRQWLVTGYHIALVFDKSDICQGVSHEFAGG